jgi:hypothetical protein
MRLAGNYNLRFPVEHVDEGIVRGGVLAQFLAFVEGKQSDITSFGFGDLAGDDCASLIVSQTGYIQDFGFWCNGHGFLQLD